MSSTTTPDFIMAVRSTPQPKAKPEYFWGSIPPARSTFGCTIPAPPNSSQPSLHKRQRKAPDFPVPLHTAQEISTSNDGSVNLK